MGMWGAGAKVRWPLVRTAEMNIWTGIEESPLTFAMTPAPPEVGSKIFKMPVVFIRHSAWPG